MGADKVGVGAKCSGAEAGNVAFDAADVGNEGTGGEVRGDLADEGDDLVHRRGHHEQTCALCGDLGGVGDGVAPRLAGQGEAGLGAARPDNDAGGDAAGAGGTGDGGAEQAGGENRELGKHRGGATQKRRAVSSGETLRFGARRGLFPPRMDYSKIPEHHVTTIGDEERAVRRKQWRRIWVAVAVAAGAAIWGWMAHRGAESANKVEATQVQAKLAADVEALVKSYRELTAGGQVSAEALARLDQAIAAEKARQNQGGANAPEDQKYLEKLETERDDWLGQAALPRLASLEAAAEALRAAGDWEAAAENLRKALALQRAINGGSAAAQVKDYVRETRLAQALMATEAGPGQQTVRAALAKAEAAEAAQRWSEARAAYIEARAAQLSLNQKFRGARYADTATLTRIEQKLAALPGGEAGAPPR